MAGPDRDSLVHTSGNRVSPGSVNDSDCDGDSPWDGNGRMSVNGIRYFEGGQSPCSPTSP